ncbi:MAG: M48 family metallopeptidase [Planctomycetaceae bacterium]|nr:M48 family metallopeptidase [Planctomycetaceae bacterium]
MDFFQHQDKAKSRTFLLVVLYVLGLIGLTIAIVAVAMVFCVFIEAEPDPMVILVCVGSILILVIGGSLFKTAELSAGGGRGVAESIGGRQVSASSTDPAEQRLYNVVEEMALAAGVPMPTLYIMQNERSINAFAAGFSPNAAVIGVNRGTVDLLTRDELQGVIAHEFSHILNGDMRMNLRLIGILFGLQLLAIIGYYAIRAVRFVPASGGRNKGGGGIIIALLVGGIALMIIGYIGVFFSAIIRAAISRQREFLADASAVQFTRNPDGIAGALKKIGCPQVGSNFIDAHAAEMSHLFFGDVCGLFSLGGLLATHPDLTTRIRRIDPRFDGRFPKMSDIRPVHFSGNPKRTNFQPTTSSKQSVIGHIGELNIANILAAGTLLQTIPKAVTESASNPLSAQAVFFAMLLDADISIRSRQFSQIQATGSPFLLSEAQRLYPHIRSLSEEEKIPLAQHVSASLREMTSQQYRIFSKRIDSLIEANKKMDLFQYTIKAMLLRDLDIYFGLAKQLRVRHTELASVRLPVVVVLSYLAYSGHDNQQETLGAFSAAMKELDLLNPILLPTEMSVQRFDQSLRTLAETCPTVKKKIFAAFMTCVWYDGKITPKEAGLIRAIAAMLAIPIPVLT